jgi:hypothetical protein
MSDQQKIEPAVRLFSAWMGRPINELTREELLEVVEWCGREIQNLRSDRDRWRESGSSINYLMACSMNRSE